MIYVLIIYQDNEPDKLIGYLNSNGIICQSFSISQIQDNFYEQYKLFDIIIFENVSNPEIENKIKYSIPIISIYNDKIKFSHTNEYLVLDYKSSLNELIFLIIKSLVRIAHKVKTEYLLEYERKKLYDIFENMNTGILTCDDNFDILFYNKKANELLGLDTTKNLIELATILKAKKGKEILYNKEYEFYHKLLENNLNKNIENIEIFYNGKTRYINAYISNFGENTKLYLITIIDETEKVKLQTELTLSQKLEAVGRLVAGIAHEINTPMQFINDNLTFLKDSCLSFNDFINKILSYYKNDDKFIELLQKYDIDYLKDEVITAINESFDGVERIIKIVTAMEEFSHTSGSKEKTLVNINKIIETTLTISRNVWKYHSNLKSELDGNSPLVECNSDEIGQVLLNMIVNSAHAIEEKFKDTGQKGIIEIKTWQEDNFIVISIKDNGKGIKEEHLNRIYDPFFTTKEVGKGTGQGLAIAHDIIVNKHNGNIQCNSVYGEGTEFLIFLPIKVQNGKEI
ncbi:MAG TPA: ATP-binding protein [Ignavibacteriales bacterium]|nr:ATP-binding protein [Ignavibacteriales bacterium]HOL80260.1 ATP-binding protein [Ignavibacteriales bacterium]